MERSDVWALKKEGLGCLPAQDRSAVPNLTMPRSQIQVSSNL